MTAIVKIFVAGLLCANTAILTAHADESSRSKSSNRQGQQTTPDVAAAEQAVKAALKAMQNAPASQQAEAFTQLQTAMQYLREKPAGQ